jgi:ABC-type antimicrobial peptide transport system permease subunit
VVADERDNGVQEKAPTVVYWPLAMNRFWDNEQFVRRSMVFAIRSKRAGSAALLDEVRKAIWSVAPDSPLANVRTLDEIYRRSMARTSFTLVMLGIAGAMALILGLVGVYGVISYSVSQRRREIGIRVALGARESQVSGMFLRHGLMLAGIGVACGLIAALWLKKAIESLLFGVGAGDPYTYAVMSLALIAAATAASYIPARRAAAVNPIETLRSE